VPAPAGPIAPEVLADGRHAGPVCAEERGAPDSLFSTPAAEPSLFSNPLLVPVMPEQASMPSAPEPTFVPTVGGPVGPAALQQSEDPPVSNEQDAEMQSKPRTLEQMMSLKPGDDERTEISKKISWILRHGAKKVGVVMDESGWVNVNDLLHTDILGGTTEDRLMDMIVESNVQKTRYEMEEDPGGSGGKRIRAISKSRRNAQQKAEREQQRNERRRREEMADVQRQDALPGPLQEPLRRDPLSGLADPLRSDPMRGSNAIRDPVPGPLQPMRDPLGNPVRGEPLQPPRRREDRGGWWDQYQDDGPTYEQQLTAGFLPVYQGDRLVAMARENETVRPGKRAQSSYNDFRHPSSGKGYGEKGYGEKGYGEKGYGEKGYGEKGFSEKGYGDRGYGEKGGDMKGGDMQKGDRKGKGKDDPSKGKGKYGDDGKGYHHNAHLGQIGQMGKGESYGGNRHETDADGDDNKMEAKGDRYGRQGGSRQMRWRAVSGQDIIVRCGLGMETEVVGTLLPNSLVAQIGEDKMLKNGISRMFIDSIDPQTGIKGWVTRSAEAAGGPVFFKQDRSSPPARPDPAKGKGDVKGGMKGEKGDKGGGKMDGKNNFSQGKGRRPIGEGEAGGTYNR